jgi:creatinine amidohydrolase
MRPYILAESNWKTIKDAEVELVVLPWGATEAHNYHLPYGTDVYQADFIAAESARIAYEKGAKLLVLPTVPFGVNTGQVDIRLDINLNPSTQAIILDNIIEVLNRQGIYKLMILNGHGGNDFKTMLRELGLKYPKMFLCTSNWFHSLKKSDYFEEGGDHADEMETSLMMLFTPHLVRPLSEAGDGKEKKHKIKEFSEGWVWAERKWSQISTDTGTGNPKKASKEKGEKYFKNVTQKIGEVLYKIAKADVADLYE